MKKLFYLSSSKVISREANSIHVMRMCDALTRFYNVTLFCRSGTLYAEDPKKFYGVKNNFELFYYNSNVIAFLLIIKIKLINREVIFYGRSFPLIFLASIFSDVTLEIHQPYEKLSFFKKALLRVMILTGRLQQIIVISKPLQVSFKENISQQVNVIVLHDGADPNPHEKKYRKNISRIGYVGHLYSGRGIPLILSLAKFFPSIEFDIIGGNPNDIAYWEAKTETSNVNYSGFQPPTDIPKILTDFDLLLAPYEPTVSVMNQGDTSQYMSPLKLFEYMASGTPFIASKLPAITTITDQFSGYTANPNSVEEWVAQIKLLNSKLKRIQVGQSAVNLIKTKYSWEKRAANIHKALTKR